jgi:hypothetical protein
MTKLSITGPDLREATEVNCEDDDISKLPENIGVATSKDPNAMRRWLNSCRLWAKDCEFLFVGVIAFGTGYDFVLDSGETFALDTLHGSFRALSKEDTCFGLVML